MPLDEQLQSFEARARDPRAWNWVALRLASAADLLTPEPGAVFESIEHAAEVLMQRYPPHVQIVGLMLYGFAIENLLKGIIVADNPEAIAGPKLSKSIRNHRLVELAKAAKLLLSPAEEEALRQLEALVLWEGRYPIPSLATDLVLEQQWGMAGRHGRTLAQKLRHELIARIRGTGR